MKKIKYETTQLKCKQRIVIILLSIIPLFSFSLSMLAAIPQQSYLIKGQVTDAKGIPLPGVTIRVSGTQLGTATDNDGNFTLRLLNSKGVLVISFVGYESVRQPYSGNQTLTIRMRETVSELDEVQVVAYGTQTKRKNIGAISSVKSEQLKGIPLDNVLSALGGLVPGMLATPQGGSPGGGNTFVALRGFSSLSSEYNRKDSRPLYVIDGIPVDNTTSDFTGQSPLASLDAKDIESIEVLKDAASGAIYGSRAGNGVILIKTKTGQFNQRAKVTAQLSYTHSFVPRLPDLMGGSIERRLRSEALRNYRESFFDPEINANRPVGSYEESYYNYAGYDMWWNNGYGFNSPILQDSLNKFYNNSSNYFKYFFQPGKVIDANLSVTGGAQRIAYNVSLGYYRERGNLIGTGFNRLKLMTNLTFKPIDKLTGTLGINFAYTDRDRASKGSVFKVDDVETYPDFLRKTSTLLPGPGTQAFDLMIQEYEKSKERNDAYNMRMNFALTYEIIKGLTLKTSLSGSLIQNNQNMFRPASVDEWNESYSGGKISRNIAWLNDNLLNYKWTSNDETHQIEALAGLSFEGNENHLVEGYGRGGDMEYVTFPDYSYKEINERTQKEFMSSMEDSRMVSYFARVQYDWKQRYLAAVTLRRDGSSRFGENHKWGTFPSYALGWAFSEEPFLAGIKKILNYGKIRASYGTSGTQFSQPYLAYGVLQSGQYPFYGNLGITPDWWQGLMNPDLKWEETDQFDIGLDASLFDYRLKVAFDYFYRLSREQLFLIQLPGNYSFYRNMWYNGFETVNKGIELHVQADLIRHNDFVLNVDFNLARNWNYLKKSNDGYDFFNPQFTDNRNILSRPLNGIYVYEDNGYYSSQDEVPYTFDGSGQKIYLGAANQIYMPGDRILSDIDQNGKIGTFSAFVDDRIYGGSPIPKAYGGININVKWKFLDLRLTMPYKLGFSILNAGRGASVGTVFSADASQMVIPIFGKVDENSFWQKPGDRTPYPKNVLENGKKSFSTYLMSNVEKVSYIEMQTATLGVSLPEKWAQKVKANARLFVTLYNVFILHNYSGSDPRLADPISGMDYNNRIPIPLKATVGLTVDF